MFTGIVEEIGRVLSVKISETGGAVSIESKVCVIDSKKGDSISVNGICLTVAEIGTDVLSFDVSPETSRTAGLKALQKDSFVNLERALRSDSRFGGHFVTGHIDSVGKIIRRREMSNFVEFSIEIDNKYTAYLTEKGSVAVDGISLTINSVKNNGFSFCVIPHTLSQTCLKYKKVGDFLNLETDILAKYVAAALQKSHQNPNNLTADFLKENGFF
ncbi:MAG: riboflavin synthase [Candidatus Omnitrophota bacterium]